MQTTVLTERTNLLYDKTVYTIGDLKNILKKIKSNEIKTSKKIIYENLSIAFDIETTSWYENDKKRATMYLWAISIEGYVVQGRTWPEATYLFDELSKYFNCSYDYKRIIVYVHNLSYEFQFMRKWFTWEKVFALDKREAIQAVTDSGIEFRCSYILSGYSLEKLSDELLTYKIKKLTGKLDYSKIRNKSTRLEKSEIEYSANDVKVVTAYIWEQIENEGNITKIPLTKTGFVRRDCREACFYGDDINLRNKTYKKYREFIKALSLTTEEYEQLKRAFMGGFTHANPLWVGDVMENVTSYDFKSDYPAKMVMYKFPMSRPKKVKITSKEELYNYLNKYACVFDIEIEGIESKILFENYISTSKCFLIENAVANNGRLYSADKVRTTVTEQDFFIIQKTYNYKKITIANFRIMTKAYLPTNLIKTLLNYYEKKTSLKNVEGKELEYAVSKTYINSMYGMMVTDICRDEIVYNQLDNWDKIEANKDEAITKNNMSGNRFLYYPWGIWVTAYARYDLWTAILECGDDYVYSDTDSVKIINKEQHSEYFNKFNKFVENRLTEALKFHKIPIEKAMPTDKKGIKHILGTWDEEGTYTKFKTLGAKRYLTEKDGAHFLTVAGVGKKDAMKYMEEISNGDVFRIFDDDLYIPVGKTGKNTLTYIDEPTSGSLIDYTGHTDTYEEKSAIHMEPCDFTLSLTEEFIKFLEGVKQPKHV